jgi:Na+/glutamate symporter
MNNSVASLMYYCCAFFPWNLFVVCCLLFVVLYDYRLRIACSGSCSFSAGA